MSEDERLGELSKLGKRSAKRDSTDDSKDENKKRCCARCRNHETELIELKGHKNYCPWRDCFCELCLKTVFRQKLMADQTASRRKRDEMKERAKKGLPLVVPTVKQASLKNPCVPTPQQSPLASFITSQSAETRTCVEKRSKEVSWEAITELMDAFSFNVNTSCLLYLVLKYISNNNVKDARSIILSAKEDIKKISNKTFSNGTGPVTQSTYMNQLEVVPVIVVPTEKVLDLSYQPGMGYPRPNQTYPYPRPIGTIGPIPPPAGATPQCAPWKQPYRQPWPHPPQIYEHNSFNEVPTNKESRSDIVEQMKSGDDETEEKLQRTDKQKINEDKVSDSRNKTPDEEIEVDIKSTEEEEKKEEIHRPYIEKGTDKDSIYKDEFYIYGLRVGNELRRIPDRHSTSVAKLEIDRVIIRAMMGEYYVGDCQCCFQEDKFKKLSTPSISPSLPSSSFQPYKPHPEQLKYNPLENDEIVKRKLSQDILSPVRNEYLTPNTSPLPIPFRPMVNLELSKWNRLESDEESFNFGKRKSSLDILSPTTHSSRSTSPLPSSFRPIVQRSQSPKWNSPHNDGLQLSFMKRKSLDTVSPVKDYSSTPSTSPLPSFRPFIQSESKRPQPNDVLDQPSSSSFNKLKLADEIRPPVIIKESLRPTTSTV